MVKAGDLVIVAQKNSDLRDIVQLIAKHGDGWTFERLDPAEKFTISVEELDSVHPVRPADIRCDPWQAEYFIGLLANAGIPGQEVSGTECS